MSSLLPGIYTPNAASRVTTSHKTGLSELRIAEKGGRQHVTLPAGDLLILKNEKKTRFTRDVKTTTVTLPDAVTAEIGHDGKAVIKATVVQTEKRPGLEEKTTVRSAMVTVALSALAMQFGELPVEIIVGLGDFQIATSSLRFDFEKA